MGIPEFYRGPSGRIIPGPKVNITKAIKELKNLFHQKKLPIAYLFGSYGQKKAKETSDVDIAILLENLGEELYQTYRELFLAIREILSSERFDLLLLNNVPLTFQFEIIQQGHPLYYRNEEVLNDFETKVICKYQDTVYLRKVQNEFLKERALKWYSKKKVY